MDQKEFVSKYDFFKKLQKMPFIDEIWLYGSRARGDFNDRSDIDLAVVCPHATAEEWEFVVDCIDSADTLLKIDCTRFDSLKSENLLKSEILKNHIVLFKRV